MDRDIFWQLIEDARKQSHGDLEVQRLILIDELSKTSEAEIIEFYRIYKTILSETYHADLWNACALINCGCHEEGFLDFRAWLIAQGKEIFYQAVNDPETLVSVVSPEDRHRVRHELFSYIALNAYEVKTGYELELESIELPSAGHLVGKLLEQNELPAKFPRLAAKLGDCD